jgi:hypothetical protein
MATPAYAQNMANRFILATFGGYFKHPVGSYPKLLR